MRTRKPIVVRRGVCTLRHLRTPMPDPAPVFHTGPFLGRVLAVFVIIASFSFFNVWISDKHFKLAYSVSAALEEKRNLQRETDNYRTEMLALQSPSRIEALARNELGMVDPRIDRVLR